MTISILRLWLPNVESEPRDLLPPRRQLKALWVVLWHNRLFLLFVICGSALCEVEHNITVFFTSPAYQAAGIAQNWYGALSLSLNLAGMAGGLLSARKIVFTIVETFSMILTGSECKIHKISFNVIGFFFKGIVKKQSQEFVA